MPVIHTERLPDCGAPEIVRDPGIIETYLEDGSGAQPGRAAGLVRIASEAEAASFLSRTAQDGLTVQIQAARSSLTGGAVPAGETIVSVERMADRGPIEKRGDDGRVTVQPGKRLSDLQAELAPQGYYYPPIPTFKEAMIGGTTSTNAGGPASFKYGVTRDWVVGLRVLLFNGELLALERGQYVARRGEAFTIQLSDGRELVVPVPDYRIPDLKKLSAGYYSSDPFDLVDLFVGAEGTLGLITAVTVNLVKRAPAMIAGLAFLKDPQQGLRLAGALREAALKARSEADSRGPDIRAIEWLDANCLRILRDHGDASKLRIALPEECRAAVFFEMELPEAITDTAVEGLLVDFQERHPDLPDRPLIRLFRILEEQGVLDELEFAFPEDEGRYRMLAEFRECAPTRVNEILAERRRVDPLVGKVGGDLIVPFEALPGMLEVYESGFASRGLDFAIWGHLSDGNMHPNALPRNAAESHAAIEALHEFAAEAIKRGGAPLSEHGVGRHPLKQELLRRFLGDAAIQSMRRIKRALDPGYRFAPGVLFPAD
jgi:D-lactate dehydrogenase (cytochrome)